MTEYLLLLDDLNNVVAQFAWVSPEFDGSVVRLSLPRNVWEQMDRPGHIRVEVSA